MIFFVKFKGFPQHSTLMSETRVSKSPQFNFIAFVHCKSRLVFFYSNCAESCRAQCLSLFVKNCLLISQIPFFSNGLCHLGELLHCLTSFHVIVTEYSSRLWCWEVLFFYRTTAEGFDTIHPPVWVLRRQPRQLAHPLPMGPEGLT